MDGFGQFLQAAELQAEKNEVVGRWSSYTRVSVYCATVRCVQRVFTFAVRACRCTTFVKNITLVKTPCGGCCNAIVQCRVACRMRNSKLAIDQFEKPALCLINQLNAACVQI
jgi:hypothetical protein